MRLTIASAVPAALMVACASEFKVRGELRGRPPLIILECDTRPKPTIWSLQVKSKEELDVLADFVKRANDLSAGSSLPVIVVVRGELGDFPLLEAYEHPLTPRFT